MSAGSEDGGYHAQVLVFLTKRGDSQGCACSGIRGCKQVWVCFGVVGSRRGTTKGGSKTGATGINDIDL